VVVIDQTCVGRQRSIRTANIAATHLANDQEFNHGRSRGVETSATIEVYPRLLKRLQGVFIDGIIIPMAAIGTLVALTYAHVDSTWIKVLCPLIVVLLLEPVAVCSTGGSIGHHLVGLRVRKENADERISFFAAIVRVVVKTFFGLPAFFVAFISRKRQALHDIVAKSLIVHKSTIGLPLYELQPARTRADEHAAYASIWRRIGVILLYWILFYILMNIVAFVVLGGPCAKYGQCSEAQGVFALSAVVILLIAFVLLAFLGWRGSLYGCRKRDRPITS
jgi:uncharacterized RDD family membrane protein YckC